MIEFRPGWFFPLLSKRPLRPELQAALDRAMEAARKSAEGLKR